MNLPKQFNALERKQHRRVGTAHQFYAVPTFFFKVAQSKGMLNGNLEEVQDFINDKKIFYAF